MPAAFNLDYVASNQKERADNIIKGTNRAVINQLIKDIQYFKENRKVDRVVVLWTANTEKFYPA